MILLVLLLASASFSDSLFLSVTHKLHWLDKNTVVSNTGEKLSC